MNTLEAILLMKEWK